jgi:hypothetical protein
MAEKINSDAKRTVYDRLRAVQFKDLNSSSYIIETK